MDGLSSIDRALANVPRVVETFHRRLCLLGLIALCLVTYLPGLLRLPAVDRTEIIFADTTRDMVEKGDWLDPRYRGAVHQFRPIGTFWAQGAVRVLAGEAKAHDIRIYRVAGLIAVTLAVLALFWLSLPIVGTKAAALAAGLFAVAPLTVLLSQLAIADGLALLPATAAMLALLRLYAGPADESTGHKLAFLFWAAVGLGLLVNALHTPILIAATLAALYLFDRDLSWLSRLCVLKGLALALLIASPWIIVRALQDGVPFSGLDTGKLLAALGGAQDMKLRAFPGTFLLAALLGFLPGTALLAPALMRLWTEEREQRLARFLMSWIGGYIVYLELVSSKPGTYTVQVMFPAMALAVAMLVCRRDGETPAPRFHAMPWPPLAALFALVLLAAPFAAMNETPSLWLLPWAAVVAALFYVSAERGRAGALKQWAVSGIAALALFAVALLAVALPSIDRIWPARQIARALEGCPQGPVAVAGFNEPSAFFVLKSDKALLAPDAVREALVEGRPGYVVGEERDQTVQTLSRFQYRRLRPLACVEAYNAMRGCPLYFTLLATGSTAACNARETFPCTQEFRAAALAAKARAGCD